MTAEVLYAIGALASGVAACLAWIAKLRWSKEFADAKDAQIKMLQSHIETLRDLTPAKFSEYYVNMKKQFELFMEDLQKQLEQANKEITQKNEAIRELKNAGETQSHTIDELELQKAYLEHKIATLDEKVAEVEKAGRTFMFWRDVQDRDMMFTESAKRLMDDFRQWSGRRDTESEDDKDK